MIRPLRRRHRLIVSVLGVVLPTAFAAGLAARKPVPVSTALPTAIAGRSVEFATVLWTKTALWPGHEISTRIRRSALGSLALDLAVQQLPKADVLVYWVAGAETAGDGLPKNARLLGALAEHTLLPLPTGARGERGVLVLYSLADHEIVATSNAFLLERD